MRFIYGAVLTVLMLAMATSVRAAPDISVQFSYYDIAPASLKELATVVFRQTPIRIKGKKYAGQTRWWISYRYRAERSAGQCRIRSINLKLDITYTMPRLAPNRYTPVAVRKSFERYYQALLKHEKGHGRHGRGAVRDAERELKRLAAAPDCEALDRRLRKTFQAVVDRYRKRDADYDRLTIHGCTQGACFGRQR